MYFFFLLHLTCRPRPKNLVSESVDPVVSLLTGGKPVILVVMHHTSNLEHVVAESWRQVKNKNVHLTVDCLVYEGKLLDCSFNDIMWRDIGKFFRVSIHQVTSIHTVMLLHGTNKQTNKQPHPQ